MTATTNTTIADSSFVLALTSVATILPNLTSNAIAAPFGDVPTENDDRLLLALVLLVPFVALPLLLVSCFGLQKLLDGVLPNRQSETEEEFAGKAHRPLRLLVKVWLSVSHWGLKWFFMQIMASLLACVMLVFDFYHEGPRETWMFAVEVSPSRPEAFL